MKNWIHLRASGNKEVMTHLAHEKLSRKIVHYATLTTIADNGDDSEYDDDDDDSSGDEADHYEGRPHQKQK